MKHAFLELTRGFVPRVTGGHVRLSEKPGLGIEMDCNSARTELIWDRVILKVCARRKTAWFP